MCTGDELVLALLSVIQVTNPALLIKAGPEGFAVDLAPLEKKPQLTADEQLIVRLHEIFGSGAQAGPYAVDLSLTEAARVHQALEILARAREWPADMQRMNRDLRARLGA